MKSIFISFALAFGGPAVLNAAPFDLDAVAIRELAPWALMLLGLGGFGAALRWRPRPGPSIA